MRTCSPFSKVQRLMHRPNGELTERDTPMIFGMTLFTFLHVLLSVIGIGSAFVISFGLFTARRLEGWTALFLATTVLTSVTGFLFPFHRFLPSHGVGIISLIVLAIAIFARYARRLVGAWRRTYVISATTALCLNVFVLIAQLFQKVPALKAMAPTQSQPPVEIAQLVVLVLFIVLGVISTMKFRDIAVRTA
jgi:hypothetical protein